MLKNKSKTIYVSICTIVPLFMLVFNTGLCFGFYKCEGENGAIIFSNTGCPNDSDEELEPLPYEGPDYLTDEELENLLTINQSNGKQERREQNKNKRGDASREEQSLRSETYQAETDSEKTVVANSDHKGGVSEAKITSQGSSKNASGVRSKYFTTLYKGMSLYRNVANLGSDYRKLDDIIDECKKRLADGKVSSRKQALRVMQIIGGVVNNKNYGFSNYVLRDKTCKYSLIYTAVGEALKLPVYAVNVPGHVFVRYQLKTGGHVNWEHQNLRSYKDGFYITGKYSPKAQHISQTAKNSGTYLRNLNKQELLAVCYNALGRHYAGVKNYTQAVAEFTEAIRLAPKLPELHMNRGGVYASNNYFDEALRDFNAVINYAPRNEKAYLARGKVWFSTLKPQKAVNDFETVLALNSENVEARKLRNKAQKFVGKKYYVKGVHKLK